MKKIFSLLTAFMLAASPVFAAFGTGPFGDYQQLSVFSGDLTLENGELISNSTDGVVCLQGAGGTNNEDICFDLETSGNTVSLSSNTGVTVIGVGATQLRIEDNFPLNWGGQSDSRISWRTEGNDNLQIGTNVGSATGSGYFSLVEKDDIGNANRSPSGTSTDPVLRVYSSDESQADDYIELTHDQNTGFLSSGTSFVLNPKNGLLRYSENGSTLSYLYFDAATDQHVWQLLDAGGNHLIIANGNSGLTADFDHATTTDPTLFGHSDLDPDVSNNQWWSITHNQEDVVISSGANVGTGTGATTDENAIEFHPRGTLAVEIDGDGGLIPKFTTADPCGAMKEGSIFYNDTSDYMCYCNGAGADLQLHDPATACY